MKLKMMMMITWVQFSTFNLAQVRYIATTTTIAFTAWNSIIISLPWNQSFIFFYFDFFVSCYGFLDWNLPIFDSQQNVINVCVKCGRFDILHYSLLLLYWYIGLFCLFLLISFCSCSDCYILDNYEFLRHSWDFI